MLFETVTGTIKSPSDQARKLTQTILNMQRFYLKVIKNKNKIYFEEKMVENKNNPKEDWVITSLVCLQKREAI